MDVNSPNASLNALGEKMYTNEALECWMYVKFVYYNCGKFEILVCRWCGGSEGQDSLKRQKELEKK